MGKQSSHKFKPYSVALGEQEERLYGSGVDSLRALEVIAHVLILYVRYVMARDGNERA